ncbi:hypothetical protein EON80_11915 [bacterium]|nr:MAG: hypothetical protein EON80_11915 [bacterium]
MRSYLPLALLLAASTAHAAPIAERPLRVITHNSRFEPVGEGFKMTPDTATILAFSPDGKTLVTGGENCPLQFWDVATGREKSFLKQRFKSNYAVEFSPDGKWLALGGSEHVGVTLWNTRTGKKVRTLAEPYPISKGAHTYDVHWSRDSKTIFANPGGRLQVWNATSGKLVRKIKSKEHQLDLLLSPDGKTLVSTDILKTNENGFDKTVTRFWDASSLKLKRTIANLGMPLTYSPDGRQIVTRLPGSPVGNYPFVDSKIGQFYTQSGALWSRTQVRITANGDAEPLAFSPNGKLLAVGRADKTIYLYNGRVSSRPSYLPVIDTLREGNDRVSALAFSPDGKLLASAGDPGKVKLWRVN